MDLYKDDFTDYLDLEAIKKMCYSFIFQVIKTETSEDHFTVDASDEQSCNWMRFVNCAHSEDQQNLVSFQQGGEIYYRTCKAIAVLVSCLFGLMTSSIQRIVQPRRFTAHLVKVSDCRRPKCNKRS